jgi:hypothetical protein
VLMVSFRRLWSQYNYQFSFAKTCSLSTGRGHYKIISHRNVKEGKGFAHEESDVKTILYGGQFFEKEIVHLINTTLPFMTERDTEWLVVRVLYC